MYIEKVEIENFRIFGAKVEIFFQKGLNMLIGENNSGKTAIIDAIRLVMSLGTYKRNLYMDESDFHINEYGVRSSEAKISIYFNDLNENQKAELIYLNDVINPTSSNAEIRTAYVAMTRPQKILIMALPKSVRKTFEKSPKFDKNFWTYIDL